MLIETKLTIHALGVFVLCCTVDDRRAPQTSHDVDVVDDGLAATEGECSIEVEEVERLGVLFAVGTYTIYKTDVQIRAVVAAEQGSIVSHIAQTGRERCLDGYRLEVVVMVMVVLDAPSIAADDTMESLDGVQQSSHGLTPEAVPTALAVVEWRKTQAVQRFTNGHTATGGSEEVVNGRGIGLTEEFPFSRAQQGEGCRLPITQAVGTCRIEVEVAVIGVGEHVHREQVVIPYQTPAEVLADAMQRRLYEGFLQQETVHQMHTDIDAGDFEGRTPEALLGFKSHRAIARLLIFFSHLLPDMGVLPEVVLIAPVTTEGQTGFDDGTTAVARRMVIVARVAPTHRSKGAQCLVELIIGIEARLQGNRGAWACRCHFSRRSRYVQNQCRR